MTGMAELTAPARVATIDSDVVLLLDNILHPTRREDAFRLCELMSRATGEPPHLWGTNIVGFGTVDFTYVRGRSGIWMGIGFSPRSAAMAVYLMDGFAPYAAELERLGPHTREKSCLFLKGLDDVDLEVLEQLLRRSYLAVTTTTRPLP